MKGYCTMCVRVYNTNVYFTGVCNMSVCVQYKLCMCERYVYLYSWASEISMKNMRVKGTYIRVLCESICEMRICVYLFNIYIYMCVCVCVFTCSRACLVLEVV